MPPNQGLTEEQIQRILDTYDEEGNMAVVAEKLSHSKDTVQKYLHERHPKWNDDGKEKASVDRAGIADFEDADYFDMTHYDFIHWFFSIPGNSKVNNDLVDIIAHNAQVRKQLPDRDRLREILVQGDSGIGNQSDVQMIVETYEKVMEDYMDAKGMSAVPQSQQPSAGAWMDTPGGPNAMGQQGQQVGGWQSTPNGQPQPQGVGPAGGRTNPGGYQPPPPGYYQNGDDKEQRREIRRLQRRMEKLDETIRQGLSNDTEDEKQSPREAIQEMVEMKKALAELEGSDDDGADEAVQAIRKELQQLQGKIAAESDGGDGDDSGLNSVLMQMAMRDDADPEMFKTMADAFGATDPEVKKAELEFESERLRHSSRREMVDAFFENIANLGGDNFETMLKIAENLTSPGRQPQGQQPQGQYQQPAQQPPRQAPQQPQQPQQPQARPQNGQGGGSPARRRIESRAQSAQQQPEPQRDPRADRGYDDGYAPGPRHDPEPDHHHDPRSESPPEQEETGGYWDDEPAGGGRSAARRMVEEAQEGAVEAVEPEPVPEPEPEPEPVVETGTPSSSEMPAAEPEPEEDVVEAVEAADPEPEPEPDEADAADWWEDVTAEELADQYDTSDYQSFAREVMPDVGGDGSICGKLWSRVKESRGDDE